MADIEIRKVSITNTGCEAVVNAANDGLWAGGGVCGAVFNAAGYEELTKACSEYGHCDTGSAVITPGFALSKYIIHAVGPVWHGGHHGEPQLLYSAYRSSLELCLQNDIHSVAFPLISSGIFGYPEKEAWGKALQACNDFVMAHADFDLHIVFAVIGRSTLQTGKKVLEELKE